MITHVVMWKLKDGVDAAECKERLDSLPPKIPEIRTFEVGIDVAWPGRSWDMVLVSTFDDLDALERYRVHPDHQVVVAHLADAAAAAASVDFET